MSSEDIIDEENLGDELDESQFSIEKEVKFIWSEARQFELIYGVQGNPAIYDVLSAEHKSAGNKKSYWENVAKSVSGTPSITECKKKWKALRVQYTRIL